MATWEQVRRYALALPGVTETTSRGNAAWLVNKHFFLWERPLRKSDLAALGDAAPAGPILGVRTADLEMKEAILRSAPEFAFTTPHFDGYSAVLVQLATIPAKQLKELIVEAWLTRAPERAARAYLAAPVRPRSVPFPRAASEAGTRARGRTGPR
ncbi:MAG TPA: MmcQ/YjbR family DNA-binding protein [Candidatus Elarobacter sp.]|nr:MmcQ/YjbR family DNA-binding protein [Candidatus Elarobacter sp.]